MSGSVADRLEKLSEAAMRLRREILAGGPNTRLYEEQLEQAYDVIFEE